MRGLNLIVEVRKDLLQQHLYKGLEDEAIKQEIENILGKN